MLKWIKSILKKIINAVGDFWEVAFPKAKQVILNELLPFAIKVVKELASKDLSNEDKRQEAFDSIKEEAEAKALVVGSSLIFCIIELALQYVKGKSE